MSVEDVLARSGGEPGDVALVGAEGSWTYRELAAAVDRRAEALREELGQEQRGGRGRTEARRGGVVPFEAEPDAATVVELLALWKLGEVPAPLHARLTEPERAAARAALSEPGLPEGTQIVIWTSGTSGRPRGVALSYGNLAAITTASVERLDLGRDDVWLASLSPAHVGGLVLVVRSILVGGTLVAAGPLGIGTMIDLLRGTAGRAPSHLSLVPTQLQRLLDGWGSRPPPETLRCVLVGGAHAPASLVARAVAAGWPLALTYGATEMSSQIATAPPELVRAVPGTVGTPMPGVEVRISASGEIECRGPTRALGYVRAAATSRDPGGPTPSGSGGLADGEGWYRTGDLGRLDDAGRLWITGRRVDRIVTGGVTVDALEVEEALRGHPSVVDACVVGVPDDEWGERVAACVVPVAGEFDPEEVTEHLRGVLMPAKVPRLWYLTDTLPRNANGKVDRGSVQALVNAGGSPARP